MLPSPCASRRSSRWPRRTCPGGCCCCSPTEPAWSSVKARTCLRSRTGWRQAPPTVRPVRPPPLDAPRARRGSSTSTRTDEHGTYTLKVPPKFAIRTFGCQMNEHDSERLAGLLVADGMEPTEQVEDADLVVF